MSPATMVIITFPAIDSKFNIKYGYNACPYGICFIALANGAVCHLHFVAKKDKSHIQELQDRFPESTLEEDLSGECMRVTENVFTDQENHKDLRIILQGTDFQRQAFQVLCTIPYGFTWSYKDLAFIMRKPKALGAVANVIEHNEIAYLVPCHRIIGKSDKFKYRWGSRRKIQILKDEGVRTDWL